jgi:hypothetical protein
VARPPKVPAGFSKKKAKEPWFQYLFPLGPDDAAKEIYDPKKFREQIRKHCRGRSSAASARRRNEDGGGPSGNSARPDLDVDAGGLAGAGEGRADR